MIFPKSTDPVVLPYTERGSREHKSKNTATNRFYKLNPQLLIFKLSAEIVFSIKITEFSNTPNLIVPLVARAKLLSKARSPLASRISRPTTAP